MLIRACLALAILSVPSFGKDRTWAPGTVIAIEHIEQHYLAGRPAAVEYTIQTNGKEYILEDVVKTYLSTPPKELFAVGDVIQTSLDGGHMVLKLDTGEKRLRIARSRTVQQKN